MIEREAIANAPAHKRRPVWVRGSGLANLLLKLFSAQAAGSQSAPEIKEISDLFQ